MGPPALPPMTTADGARDMRFPHWHRQAPDPDEGPAPPNDWRDAGVGEEVQAFLAGRIIP